MHISPPFASNLLFQSGFFYKQELGIESLITYLRDPSLISPLSLCPITCCGFLFQWVTVFLTKTALLWALAPRNSVDFQRVGISGPKRKRMNDGQVEGV